MQCSDYEKQLIDFEDNQLPSLDKQALEEHLKHCDDCASRRAWIFEFSLAASRWQDAEIPEWDRLFMLESSRQKNTSIHKNTVIQFRWPQLLAMAASVMAVTLLLTQLLMTGNFQSNQDVQISQTELDEKFNTWTRTQDEKMEDLLFALNQNQQESYELLMTTLLKASRLERRRDINTLMTTFSRQQEQQSSFTNKGLLYLIARQKQDERDLELIKAALDEDHEQY